MAHETNENCRVGKITAIALEFMSGILLVLFTCFDETIGKKGMFSSVIAIKKHKIEIRKSSVAVLRNQIQLLFTLEVTALYKL